MTQSNGRSRTAMARRSAPHAPGQRSRREPDVGVDAPALKLDEVEVALDDLNVKFEGGEVHLGKVHVNLKGLEAQALVELRLDELGGIVDRVLTTVDRARPDVIEGSAAPGPGKLARLAAGTAARELGSAAGDEVKDLGAGVTRKVKELGEKRRRRRAEKHNATVAAFEAADELGVDLGDVSGSGVEGRITVRDVRDAAPSE